MVAKKKRQSRKVKSLGAKSISAKQARQIKGGLPMESLSKTKKKWY